MRNLTIPATDGYLLAATLFESSEPTDRFMIVSSASAVPRGLYRRFATHLAEQGYTTLTYDYRGIGDSMPGRLRGFDASMADWALLDMQGVLDWAVNDQGAASVFLVGHSVGGQVAGMLERTDRVRSMVTVSAQSAHWRHQPKGDRTLVWLSGYVTLPILSSVVGYGPWSWFGPGEDIPKGVAKQWASWIRKRRYLLDDPSLPLDRYATFTKPVLAYSIDDDRWGSARAVDAFMLDAYPDVERVHIDPTAHDIDHLGHMGYFKPDASSLWPDLVTWFAAH